MASQTRRDANAVAQAMASSLASAGLELVVERHSGGVYLVERALAVPLMGRGGADLCQLVLGISASDKGAHLREEIAAFARREPSIRHVHVVPLAIHSNGRLHVFTGVEWLCLDGNSITNDAPSDAVPIGTGLGCKPDLTAPPGMLGILFECFSLRKEHTLARGWLPVLLMAAMFGGWLDTRPIGMFWGGYGSGKTSAAGAVQRLLGGKFRLANGKIADRDFAALMRDRAVHGFDNLDDATGMAWLCDVIASFVSTGVIECRELHTTADRFSMFSTAVPLVTTRTGGPFPTRDDVMSRTLIIPFEKPDKCNPKFEALFEGVRLALVGGMINLAQGVVAEVNANGGGVTSDQRLAGVEVLARATGRVLGWAPDQVDLMLAEQDSLRATLSPSTEMLMDWIVANWTPFTALTASEVARMLLSVTGVTVKVSAVKDALVELLGGGRPGFSMVETSSGGVSRYAAIAQLRMTPSV